MLKGIAVGLTIATMLVASCGSSDDSSKKFSCATAKSKCANDGAIPKEICDALNDPNCSDVFLEFAVCAADHQVCKMDQTTDVDATFALCQPQRDKAQKCSDDHADAGSGGG